MNKSTGTSHPTHHVFVVDGEGDKVRWTRIGTAWQHADANGLNLTLHALPLHGRIVIRTAGTGQANADGARTRKGRSQ